MSELMKVVHVNEKDSAVIALQPIAKGDSVTLPNGEVITALEDIPASHKIAIVNIKKGEHIIKYGESIGVAAEDLAVGRWIHAHVLVGSQDYNVVVDSAFDKKNIKGGK